MLIVQRAARAAHVTLVLACFSACSDSSGDPNPGSGGMTTTTATAGSTAVTSSASSSGTTAASTGASSTTANVTTTATGTANVTSTGTGTGTGTGTSTGTTGSTMTGAGGMASTTAASDMTTTSTNTSTGTGTGTGGTGGGTSNAAVSDDFEGVAAGGPPDPALWQLQIPAGGSNAIEVTTEQAHSGSQSVKVTGMSGSTMFYNESVFPLPSGVVYFRVWMRFTNANWSGHNAFVASSPGQESQEVRFGGQNNAYHANLAAAGDGLSPDPFEYPECPRCVAPVADEWKCLRGKFDFTGQAAELYVGDELAVDSAADGWHSGDGTFPQNPTRIGFGWALYGAEANTVYYDDLAIGYEPIACE